MGSAASVHEKGSLVRKRRPRRSLSDSALWPSAGIGGKKKNGKLKGFFKNVFTSKKKKKEEESEEVEDDDDDEEYEYFYVDENGNEVIAPPDFSSKDVPDKQVVVEETVNALASPEVDAEPSKDKADVEPQTLIGKIGQVAGNLMWAPFTGWQSLDKEESFQHLHGNKSCPSLIVPVGRKVLHQQNSLQNLLNSSNKTGKEWKEGYDNDPNKEHYLHVELVYTGRSLTPSEKTWIEDKITIMVNKVLENPAALDEETIEKNVAKDLNEQLMIGRRPFKHDADYVEPVPENPFFASKHPKMKNKAAGTRFNRAYDNDEDEIPTAMQPSTGSNKRGGNQLKTKNEESTDEEQAIEESTRGGGDSNQSISAPVALQETNSFVTAIDCGFQSKSIEQFKDQKPGSPAMRNLFKSAIDAEIPKPAAGSPIEWECQKLPMSNSPRSVHFSPSIASFSSSSSGIHNRYSSSDTSKSFKSILPTISDSDSSISVAKNSKFPCLVPDISSDSLLDERTRFCGIAPMPRSCSQPPTKGDSKYKKSICTSVKLKDYERMLQPWELGSDTLLNYTSSFDKRKNRVSGVKENNVANDKMRKPLNVPEDQNLNPTTVSCKTETTKRTEKSNRRRKKQRSKRALNRIHLRTPVKYQSPIVNLTKSPVCQRKALPVEIFKNVGDGEPHAQDHSGHCENDDIIQEKKSTIEIANYDKLLNEIKRKIKLDTPNFKHWEIPRTPVDKNGILPMKESLKTVGFESHNSQTPSTCSLKTHVDEKPQNVKSDNANFEHWGIEQTPIQINSLLPIKSNNLFKPVTTEFHHSRSPSICGLNKTLVCEKQQKVNGNSPDIEHRICAIPLASTEEKPTLPLKDNLFKAITKECVYSKTPSTCSLYTLVDEKCQKDKCNSPNIEHWEIPRTPIEEIPALPDEAPIKPISTDMQSQTMSLCSINTSVSTSDNTQSADVFTNKQQLFSSVAQEQLNSSKCYNEGIISLPTSMSQPLALSGTQIINPQHKKLKKSKQEEQPHRFPQEEQKPETTPATQNLTHNSESQEPTVISNRNPSTISTHTLQQNMSYIQPQSPILGNTLRQPNHDFPNHSISQQPTPYHTPQPPAFYFDPQQQPMQYHQTPPSFNLFPQYSPRVSHQHTSSYPNMMLSPPPAYQSGLVNSNNTPLTPNFYAPTPNFQATSMNFYNPHPQARSLATNIQSPSPISTQSQFYHSPPNMSEQASVHPIHGTPFAWYNNPDFTHCSQSERHGVEKNSLEVESEANFKQMEGTPEKHMSPIKNMFNDAASAPATPRGRFKDTSHVKEDMKRTPQGKSFDDIRSTDCEDSTTKNNPSSFCKKSRKWRQCARSGILDDPERPWWMPDDWAKERGIGKYNSNKTKKETPHDDEIQNANVEHIRIGRFIPW